MRFKRNYMRNINSGQHNTKRLNKISPPKILQVQPTNGCNLYCLFCDHRKKTKELTDKKWVQIVGEAGKMGVERLTITGGGEPMTRPNTILAIMKKAKESGVTGDIVTNGTLFNSDSVKRIIDIGWDSIVISIHGANPAIDNFLRGRKGVFEKTMKSIKLFNYWKGILGSNKPRLDFIMVVTKNNYDQMENLIELAHNLKVGGITFKMVNEGPETFGTFSITKKQINELENKTQRMQRSVENYKMDMFMDFQIEDLKQKNKEPLFKGSSNESDFFCLMPFFEIVIFSDGKCSPCCIFYERENQRLSQDIVDDISKKSLFQVWNGKCFENLRKIMAKFQPPKECLSCPPDTKYRHRTWEKYLFGQKIRYLS